MASLTLGANIVTDSSGNATAYLSQAGQSAYPLPPLGGLWAVESISYVKNDFASGVDFAITEYETAMSLWSGTDVNSSTTVVDRKLISGQLKIVISSGGNAKTGQFIVKLSDATSTGGTVAVTTTVSDGDKGDIVVSGSGSVFTIDADAVTYAKIQNVSATDKVLGRSTSGAGDVEEIACTAAGRALLAASTAAAQYDIVNVLTASPGSDHTFSGPSVSMTAGENLVFGEVVYVKSDGKLWKADADAAATAPVFAMAAATISADAAGIFILPGSFVRDDTWVWTVGGLIYLDVTAGALTQTAPSGTDDVVQVCGVATHADRMWFNPDLTFITVV